MVKSIHLLSKVHHQLVALCICMKCRCTSTSADDEYWPLWLQHQCYCCHSVLLINNLVMSSTHSTTRLPIDEMLETLFESCILSTFLMHKLNLQNVSISIHNLEIFSMAVHIAFIFLLELYIHAVSTVASKLIMAPHEIVSGAQFAFF